MTNYNNLPRQHKKILDAFLTNGNKLNSLKHRYLAIQLPVRIKELREEYGYNIPLPTKMNKDRSVDYVLLDSVSKAPPETVYPWEEQLIPVTKNGRTFWERPKDIEPKQLDFLGNS